VRLSHRQIVGQRIRACRRQAHLTQEKLAEKADLTYKYVGEVERGVVNISLDSLARIAKALRVRLRDLVDEL
jgi:transcriptional regulator with XRE-family HTH domain